LSPPPPSTLFPYTTLFRSICLWDVNSGREITRLGGDRVAPPDQLAFSPDGTRLAARPGTRPEKGRPPDMTVWDVATGRPWATLADRKSTRLNSSHSQISYA